MSREDEKATEKARAEESSKKSFHGPPPFASCLAVAGPHLMCRQHSGPRNLYGLDICKLVGMLLSRQYEKQAEKVQAWKAVIYLGNCLWS